MQKDTKANDVCENFAPKETTPLFHFHHVKARHGSNYLHKSTCWNMMDLERLTKACRKSKCAFIIRTETFVYVFSDDWD